jgi:hypothetical protein
VEETASEVRDVERINPFAFYDLSHTFLKLATIPEKTSVSGAFIEVISAHNAALELIQGKPLALGTSKASAENLATAIQAIMDRHFWTTDEKGQRTIRFPPDNVVFASWEINSFKQALETFETVFREEMREAATYYVPRRGIFYTPALVDTADESFPAELRLFVPQKSREDWRSAGRCLAFNLLSASGFHVARAVEGTLELYYEKFCGKEPDESMSWGHFLIDLEKVKEQPAPDPKTLSEIKQMKDDYRNPLMHPRVVLTEGDARMLFANGESLIIAMAQEIKKVAQSGVQPSLGLVFSSGLAIPDKGSAAE